MPRQRKLKGKRELRRQRNKFQIPRGLICHVPGQQAVLEIFPAKGGTALFYPGSMLAPGHYFIFLRALREAGFSVAAMHFSGHGLRRGHFWNTFTFDQLLAEGLAAEQFLRSRGCADIMVCGHSQGAILALAHASISPQLAAVAAISGVLPQMAEAVDITLFRPLRRWRERIMACIGHAARFFPWLPIPLPAYLSIPRILRSARRPMIMGRDLGRISYPLKYLHSLFGANIKPTMRCPTLLLGAANDDLFPPPLLNGVFELIQTQRKELVLALDGGHTAPYNDQMAQFFARKIAEFCASLGFPLAIPKAAPREIKKLGSEKDGKRPPFARLFAS